MRLMSWKLVYLAGMVDRFKGENGPAQATINCKSDGTAKTRGSSNYAKHVHRVSDIIWLAVARS